MALVNLTFDLADLIGADFDPLRTKVWLDTNIDGNAVFDSAGKKTYLGDAKATVAADGTGVFTGLIATNTTGINPTAFQYRFWVDYQPRAPRAARVRKDFGWFALTATKDIAEIAAVQYVPPTFAPWAWQGPWSSATTYQAGMLVSYGGSSWLAKAPSTNVTPVEGASWSLVASAGLPGPGSAAWTPAQAVTTGTVRQAPDGSWIKSTTSRTTSGSYTTTPAAPPVLAAPTTATTGGTIAAGTTYYYKATALSALGETLASAEVSQVIAAALATPVNAAFTTATTGGTLAAGTYSYRISATNALGQTLASTATTQVIPAALAAPVLNAPTTATTGGTLAAGTYYYKITATNAVGETIGSNEVSQVTTGTTSTVGLTWAAITGATGYKIYRATTTGGQSTSPALVASVGAVTSYTDTGTAVSAGAVPATNTTATTTNTVTVNWGAVTGATGYKVYGRVGGSELLIATVGAVTTYTDTGAVTPAGALPTANTTATNTNTVGLSWAAVTGATGYKIYRATTTGGQSTSPALLATLGAVTTYTDTGSATTAGAVPTTNTANEQAFWQSVNTYAGTQAQTELSATIAAEVPAATTTTPGRVELATEAETVTGTDTTRAVTPAAAAARYQPISFSKAFTTPYTTVEPVQNIQITSKNTGTISQRRAAYRAQVTDHPEVNQITVTGATNASPIVITAAAHGYSTGDRVAVEGVTGNTAANGLWTVTALTADTFSLDGSTGNGAFGAGGYVTNRSMLTGLIVEMGCNLTRGGLTGAAYSGDDLCGVSVENSGTGRGTDAFYVAGGASAGGWGTSFNTDDWSIIGFRAGGTYGTAAAEFCGPVLLGAPSGGFGAGDVRLRRTAAKELTFDDGAGGEVQPVFNMATTGTAVAGSNGAPPATVQGYLKFKNQWGWCLVPYYNA